MDKEWLKPGNLVRHQSIKPGGSVKHCEDKFRENLHLRFIIIKFFPVENQPQQYSITYREIGLENDWISHEMNILKVMKMLSPTKGLIRLSS